MDRRHFHRLCSSLLAGAASLSRSSYGQDESLRINQSHSGAFPQSRLVDRDNVPLRPDQLAVGSCLVFHYPYVTTPCFLIRLKPGNYGEATMTDRSGQQYIWHGASGPDHTLVAFSAICSHKMTHPSKPISYINFRPNEKSVQTRDGGKKKLSQLITCCSEHSVYDTADGARVVSGPATQPLAAVNLKLDEQGDILASGIYGGDMFEPFLQKFGFRLALEHNIADPRTLTADTTMAVPAASFSRQLIRC